MDDRERMLSEGPREAPEPLTAEGMSAGEALGPVIPGAPPPETAPDPSTEPDSSRSPAPSPAPAGPRGRSAPGWLRLAPIALVAVLGLARALGGGGWGALVFAAVAVTFVVARILQRRNR
jgi:hypothetical protein